MQNQLLSVLDRQQDSTPRESTATKPDEVLDMRDHCSGGISSVRFHRRTEASIDAESRMVRRVRFRPAGFDGEAPPAPSLLLALPFCELSVDPFRELGVVPARNGRDPDRTNCFAGLWRDRIDYLLD